VWGLSCSEVSTEDRSSRELIVPFLGAMLAESMPERVRWHRPIVRKEKEVGGSSL